MENSAKSYYKTIKRVWSPALNDYVVFNNIGFTHLLRKKGVLRPKSEQKRRLDLLPDAVDVISNRLASPTFQNGDSSRPIHIWKFIEKNEEKNIKVIVRQFEGGIKHFYSVYGKKQKTAR